MVCSIHHEIHVKQVTRYRTRKVKMVKTDNALKARLRVLDRGASFKGGIPPPPSPLTVGGALTRLNYSLLGQVFCAWPRKRAW